MRSQQENIESETYKTLMEFIQKSQLVLDKALLENEEIKEKALILKTNLDQANSSDSIFDDKNCQLYLIYLLGKNLIEAEQFLTGYLYLSVLMQFTQRQLIHPDHANAQRLNWGEPKVFDSHNEQLLMQYAADLSIKFENHISKREVLDFFKANVSSEGWLIGVPYNTQAKISEDDVKDMMDTNVRFSPLLQKYKEKEQNYVVFPSISFAKWLLQKLNPERQIEIAACFGNIGIDTLYKKFHSKNKHPVTIHSAYIKSNPKSIHDKVAGPVPFALHDIFFHCFGATAFKKNEYDFLMGIMIPTLQKVSDSNIYDVKQIASNMKNTLNDLAYNPINLIKKDNLKNYLFDKLSSKYYGSNEFEQLSEDEMRSYYIALQQLCQELYKQKDIIASEYDIELQVFLKQIIPMGFINDIEFDEALSRKEAVECIANEMKKIGISSHEQIDNRLTDSLITKPDLCLAINRAGYSSKSHFLPPLHPISSELLNEALSFIKIKDSKTENRYTIFSESEMKELPRQGPGKDINKSQPMKK